MRPPQYSSQPLQELFKHSLALTMPEMKQALGTQVDMTVFRKLAPWNYLTSYSHRGSYYSLPRLVRFDGHGLWTARGAWFSRHGTLLETLQAWVRDAPAGLFAAELEARLHVPVKDALRRLTRSRRVHRSELGGLYLYTAPARERRQEQLAARRAQTPGAEPGAQEVQAALLLFSSGLDEQQRRLFAGLESLKHGRGGDHHLAQKLGLHAETVARGRRDLLAKRVLIQGVRRAGGGRPQVEKKRQTS